MKKPVFMLIAVLLFSGIAFSQDSAIKIRQEFPNNALVVSIENANGVAGYQFNINYNPAVLKYREISATPDALEIRKIYHW